jgi:poly(A)-specific ribonuclease
MTAELFVKLTAKLHNTHKNLTTTPYSTTTSTELADSSSSDSESTSGGGAPINLTSPSTTNGQSHSAFKLTSLTDNLPPAWHAKQLNRYAVLQHDNNEEAEAEAEEPNPKQWIPSMRNAFWDAYVNKLRVNAIDGGICDLGEGAED